MATYSKLIGGAWRQGDDATVQARAGGSGWYQVGIQTESGAPVVATQPTSQVVTEPTAATFTASVTGTYTGLRWQRQAAGAGAWADVVGGTGGTTVSYTTGATDVSGGSFNNTDRFRLAVDWVGGVVYSDEAALTVSDGADTTAPSWGSVTLAGSSVTTASFTVTASGVATDNVAVTGYETSFNGGSSYTTNSPPTSVSRAYSGGTPGATVQVRMRAFDAAGNRSAAISLAQTLADTSITLGPFASNGTVWPSGTAIYVSWLPAGRIGSLSGVTPVDRTATLGSGGAVAVSGLAAGAGIALVSRRVTNAGDDEVAYQYGTVA